MVWGTLGTQCTAKCVHSYDRTDKIIVVLHYNFIDTTVINWLWRRLLPFSPILLSQFYVHWELLIITSPFFIAYGHFAHNGIHCNIARPTWFNTIRRKGGKRERGVPTLLSEHLLLLFIRSLWQSRVYLSHRQHHCGRRKRRALYLCRKQTSRSQGQSRAFIGRNKLKRQIQAMLKVWQA